MKNKIVKKIWLFIMLFVCLFNFSFYVSAQQDDIDIDWFQIIPELEEDDLSKIQESMENVWRNPQHVMENYNEEASKLTTSEQLASWIMNRDTIVNYLVYVVKFLSQLWIVVWVVFIMYAGYKYMISVFNGWKTASTTIKNAIIWVIIVIFSYAIMKILTSLVGLS